MGAVEVRVVRGSALCAVEEIRPELGTDAVMELIDALDAVPLPQRDRQAPFAMPVEKGLPRRFSSLSQSPHLIPCRREHHRSWDGADRDGRAGARREGRQGRSHRPEL